MRNSIYHFTIMLLVVFVTHVISQEVVTGVFCKIEGQSPRSDELRMIAQKLVIIREHEPLDTVSLRESVDALRVCGLFESVKVEQSGGQVNFLLYPALYVRDIHIRHEFPLFENDVEKAMSIHTGDIFRNDVLELQDSLITKLYRRDGFVCPQVHVTSREHRAAGGDREISVTVRAGEYYRLKKIEINGNDFLSDFKIKRSMKSWRSSLIPGSAGRFVESALREDIKTITELYKSGRFADVKVSDTVVTDTFSRSVNVVLSVSEGDRYKIRFSRKHDRGFRKGVLRKDIVLYKTGNTNNMGVRKSVKAIEKRMREEGFLDAQVESSDTAIEHRSFTERLLFFSIHRGPRTTVSSIKINGAAGIDEKTVRGQMLHVDKGGKAGRAYDPEKLQEDVFAVEMLYRSRGFLRVTVESNVKMQDKSAAITIQINEGPCTRIGGVSVDTGSFAGIDVFKDIKVKKGDAYNINLLKRDARLLQTIISEQGYPHAEVTPVVIMNSDSSRADVEFRISEGPMVTMGDIHYVGAFRTRARVLGTELRALPGGPLSLRDIVDTQKKLRDLGLFSSVRFRTIGLREKRDTVHVFVEVGEKRPYYGMVSGGYRSDKGAFLQSRLGDRNFLGLNKEAWVGGNLSRIGRDLSLIGGRGEIGFIEPRFLGSDIRAMVEVFGEKTSELNQDWGTRAYGISTGLITSAGKHTILGLGTRYENRRLFYTSGVVSVDSAEITKDQRPRNMVVITPSYAWDRRDSFTRPRKGLVLGSSVDISKSLDNSLDDFVKLQFEVKGYVTPLSHLTFAGVVRGGNIRPFGGLSQVPADQHFYLGGTADLRGFDENLFHPQDSSGGTAMLFASLEARIEAGFNFELALFTDIGRLENDFSSMAPNQFRSSAGAGIRYITPIGPIGILYGWKLDRKQDEKIGAFHFSIGYTF